ncbi:MAG: N-acetylmuramoyl-L-alanine amidase [Candidatus Aminicenantes bacterium]|nr:N-acetylmuramoyl-L-alanine amidase [Candidatus Aminicenantes bacterium]
MHVEKISDHEQDFDNTGIDSDGKQHTLIRKAVEIFGEDSFMYYVETRPSSGDESYFYQSRVDKDQIVLHFTMGYLKGDIATLTKADNHVSVPFLIGRNGTIYNLFSSYYWSYHLGPGAVGGNMERSQASIGIELSNIGPLKKIGDNLVNTYPAADVYCGLNQTEYYCANSFRGYDYFAGFTENQYTSLITLLRYLTARYKIPREFQDEPQRFETTPEVSGFKGIVSHVNYRASGKTDFGPCFDWNRVITGVKA